MATFVLLALGAILLWAAFHTPAIRRYRSRSGALFFFALAGISGYFDVREARVIDTLAEHIDPVPEIVDVTYVPTAAEVHAMAQLLAGVPVRSRFGTTQHERQELATSVQERRTDYWLLKTALPVDSVFAFYRRAAPRRGWQIELDQPPWLLLARPEESLVLYVSDDLPRPGIRVLYGLTAGQATGAASVRTRFGRNPVEN